MICILFWKFCINVLNSETKQKTLEEIAAAFGDRVVEIEERDILAEEAVMSGKEAVEHVEDKGQKHTDEEQVAWYEGI